MTLIGNLSLPISGTTLALLVIVSAFLYYHYFLRQIPFAENAPKILSSDIPIVGAIGFFTRRDDMFIEESKNSPTGLFGFHVGQVPCVGVTGDKGRQLFFESPQLNLAEGQSFLFGGAPQVRSKDDEAVSGSQLFSKYFGGRLVYLLNRENLVKRLPSMIQDAQRFVTDLASRSDQAMNPFDSIYNFVFVLTMRAIGAGEIADDPDWAERMLFNFQTVESTFGPTEIIFRNFPTWNKTKRKTAGAKLFMDFKKIVDKRKTDNAKADDALQFLIDSGDSMEQIIGFEMAGLFAGQINSGHNAAASAHYFSRYPTWQEKAREEVEQVVKEYSSDRNAPLIEQLASLPIEAWESMALIDHTLRETIRLRHRGSAIRRNISSKPVMIGDEAIQPGGFAVVQHSELHLDESVYPNPTEWDPERYTPERAEDKKRPFAFVGWGAGRHPCLGMRFAKLEYAVITAFMLACFDMAPCDSMGKPIPPDAPLLDISWNARSTKTPKMKVYIKCSKRPGAFEAKQ